MKTRFYIVSALLLLFVSEGFSSWKIVFNDPDGPISCGFFFDSKNGLIGEGNLYNQVQSPKIFKTTDGGVNWTQSLTPSTSFGRISSIYMVNNLLGYASLRTLGSDFLWKTTDGGNSWQNVGSQNEEWGTCVYATPSVIIETAWPQSSRAAGVSFDGGITFNDVFYNNTGFTRWSNGIDFADDLNGIVVMGPNTSGSNVFSQCWYTHDGGVSWKAGGPLPESWGVYAIKGTATFLCLPEGGINATSPSQSVYQTTDGGVIWRSIATIGSPETSFSGHITGVGSTVYVQTKYRTFFDDEGLYRSDNGGSTWKNVGGPSNVRDTRFCVTGCNGHVVYAFDSLGNVWKTIDGGDGTLDSLSDGPKITLAFDSLAASVHYCITQILNIPLINSGCSTIKFDSIILGGDISSSFSLLHTPTFDTIGVSRSDSISIQFRSDSEEERSITVRLKGSSGSATIDTTVYLHIKDRFGTSNGPVILLRNRDTVRTHFCQSGIAVFPITNTNCSPLVIDAINFYDSLGYISIVKVPAHDTISPQSSDSILLQFQSNNNVHRILPLRLKCHVLSRSFDTTLWIDASHSRSPEPYLDLPAPTKAGDTVLIALKIMPPTDTISITHLAFHLSYNGDILTPAAVSSVIVGTLARNARNVSIDNITLNGLDCSIDLNDTITNASDFTKPVIWLSFLVTLTKALSCDIILDSFSIAGTTPLPLCSVPSTTFQVLPQCGDSTISGFMLTGNIPSIRNVRPNPASDKIEVYYDLAGQEQAEIEVVDLLGSLIEKQPITAHSNSAVIDTRSLRSSQYYLRLVTASGNVVTRTFTIEH